MFEKQQGPADAKRAARVQQDVTANVTIGGVGRHLGDPREAEGGASAAFVTDC
jgi:hypothetical protein